MNKSSKSRNCSVGKRKVVPNAKNKKYKPMNIKTMKKASHSTIPIIQKNNNLKENAKNKPSTDAVPIEKQVVKVENRIDDTLEDSTFAKSSYLIEKEIRRRTVVTVQDRYRLQVSEPRNSIEKACRDCKFYCLHETRCTKPLIVIDLDTLKINDPAIIPVGNPTMLYLLEYLYRRFDIAVWSSLKMEVVIPKLENFGFFDKKNKFKINFVLDRTAMTATYFRIIGFCMVKNLEVIWNLYPHYNEHNCIMINSQLKKIVYKSYGVPVGLRQRDKLVDEVTMTIIFWDEQGIFMEHRFITPSDKFINAIAISKMRLLNCSTDEILTELFHLNDKVNVENGTKLIKPELTLDLAKWIESNEISSKFLRSAS